MRLLRTGAQKLGATETLALKERNPKFVMIQYQLGLDSTSVLNGFGPSPFTPPLPAYDPSWELTWTKKIERWLPYVQGDHTYINFGDGIRVTWFPEYDLNLGAPVDAPGLHQDQGAFVRRFANALVVVNPGDSTLAYTLPAAMRLVTPVGGGAVPDDGREPASWGLQTTTVTTIALGPRRAAVLLH